ncbi:MAG: hypothetical protein O2800_04075 [Planctomycetota bacterium]|nr:hypothetical protein [Planctomycetota bacterium]
MAKTTTPIRRSGEMDVYSVLLVAATLCIAAALVLTALRNMELSKSGGSGGGPFDLVSGS